MTSYQVLIRPLESLGHYGAEIDITDWVLSDNFSEITRAIDSTDYDIGIYATNDVTLVVDASDGYLNDQTDSRSIFHFSRDLAKVRILFLKDGSTLSSFQGVINEDGSFTDAESNTVSFVVTGYDGVLAKVLVPSGAVPDGCTFQQAFSAILGSSVGGILNIDWANITPAYNGTVDLGKAFDNKTAKNALDSLLLPANSVLLIDSTQTVYIRSRENSANSPLYLYGKGDLLDRENINVLRNHNNGRQRTFNLIRVIGAQATSLVTDTGGFTTSVNQSALVAVAQDDVSIEYYGIRLKELAIDFVTRQATLDAIAEALKLEFRYPKPEVEVTVPTELLQSQTPPTDLLDLVSVTYPLSARPQPGCRLPFIGITSIGDTSAPLPFTEGALSIESNIAWKVIEMRESPKDFVTVLKLRVSGTDASNGVFDFIQTESGLNLQTESGENLSI